MVSLKIFEEFRNGCDEKSATVLRHSPHRNPDEIPESFAFAFAPFLQKLKKIFANSVSGKSTKNLRLLTLEFKFLKFKSANAEYFLLSINFASRPSIQLKINNNNKYNKLIIHISKALLPIHGCPYFYPGNPG